MLELVERIGQDDAVDQLREPITQMTETNAAGFALVFGLAGAVWSASGYVGAFGRAMNKIYEVDEGRPFWKLRPLNLAITVVTVLLAAVVLLGLVVTGPFAEELGDTLGLGDTTVTVWNIVKWPIMLLVVVFVVAVLYYATPNVKQPKFRWISVGAGLAIVVWILASAAFGLYVANFGSYNKTYGSLAGVIILLLWIWLTNLALLFGAEVDAEIERSRQLQAGIEAEESIQLPPRDTRRSEKEAAKLEAQIDQGRQLREEAAAGVEGPTRRTVHLAESWSAQRDVSMSQRGHGPPSAPSPSSRFHPRRHPARAWPRRVHRRDRAASDPAVASHVDGLRITLVVSDDHGLIARGQHGLGRPVPSQHVGVRHCWRVRPVACAGCGIPSDLAQPRRVAAGRMGHLQRGRRHRRSPHPHHPPRAR